MRKPNRNNGKPHLRLKFRKIIFIFLAIHCKKLKKGQIFMRITCFPCHGNRLLCILHQVLVSQSHSLIILKLLYYLERKNEILITFQHFFRWVWHFVQISVSWFENIQNGFSIYSKYQHRLDCIHNHNTFVLCTKCSTSPTTRLNFKRVNTKKKKKKSIFQNFWYIENAPSYRSVYQILNCNTYRVIYIKESYVPLFLHNFEISSITKRK